MSRTSYLLVLARLEAERRRKLGVIASASQLELAAVEDTNAALAWLEHHEPEVVAFESSTPKAEQLCQKLRGRKSWGRVPMLALADEPSDAHVEKLFAMGVDDVVPLSAWPAFIARVRALPRVESIHPPPARGKAIVADPERQRCDVIGRVLTNAGFDVRYALDRRALEYYSLQTDVALIVVNVELGAPRQFIEQARKNKSNAAWVVATRRRDLEEHTRALADLDKVALAPALGAPESVLFIANELLSNRRTARSSTRVLHGTLVAFRPAGTDSDDIGFSYNISGDGLYVRTLAVPEGEEVWLELSPPKHNRRVRLLGRVVWRRGFEGNIGASVPPGFGVQLLDGLGDALSIWRESYLSLDGASETAHKPKKKPPPPKPKPPAPGTAPEPEVVEAIEDVEPELMAMAPRMASQPDIARISAPEIEIGRTSVPTGLVEPGQGASPRPERTPPAPAAEPAPAPAVEPALPPQPEGSRGGVGLLVALLIVAAGAAVFVLWQRGMFGAHQAPTPAPAEKPSAVAQKADQAPPAPKPTPSASAAPKPPPEPTADLSALTPTEGYLYVKTTLDAKVYINGRVIGPTNQPVKTGCGMRFVRVGKPVGHWLTEGRSVKIECGKLTKAEFTPSPPPPTAK